MSSDDMLDLIFMFTFATPAANTEDGEKRALPTMRRCKQFASSTGMLIQMTHAGAFDGALEMRVCFNIKGDQNSVLKKVAALFAFAAALELTLVNQFFLPEKKL